MIRSVVDAITDAGVTVRGAAFIGIGSMVGAGIFALLGQAAVIAGAGVWLSFLLAGIVTMLLAYNVVKLGIRYPSQGGLIQYCARALGTGGCSGSRRGSDTPPPSWSWSGCSPSPSGLRDDVFIGDDAWSGWDNLFASLVIVGE